MKRGAGYRDDVATAQMEAWLRDEPGSIIAQAEQRLMAHVLPDLFGYHLVQLGCHHRDDLVESSRISHRVRIELGMDASPGASMRCRSDALPLATGSVDVLVLPHVLEFAPDPRRVLREAERVLIGEGHIAILGFSPWSLYGAVALLRRWQERAPWSAHLIAAARVKDWLQLLGFDIVHCLRASFRPPTRRVGVNRRLEFLEQLGGYCWPVLGNVYLVVGKKRVEGITPLKVDWKARRRVVAGLVEPTTREPARRDR